MDNAERMRRLEKMDYEKVTERRRRLQKMADLLDSTLQVRANAKRAQSTYDVRYEISKLRADGADLETVCDGYYWECRAYLKGFQDGMLEGRLHQIGIDYAVEEEEE